jgi:hypothetical protein
MKKTGNPNQYAGSFLNIEMYAWKRETFWQNEHLLEPM